MRSRLFAPRSLFYISESKLNNSKIVQPALRNNSHGSYLLGQPRSLPSAEKSGTLCEPSLRSAAFRGRIKIRVLCACDFLSYIWSHTRGCVLTQGTLLASALAVGDAVVVVTIAFTGPYPIFAVVTVGPLVSSPSLPTVTTGPTAISASRTTFGPVYLLRFLHGSDDREDLRPTLPTLSLCTHFELFMLEFIVGIDGKAAPPPSIPTIPSMFLCKFASDQPQILRW